MITDELLKNNNWSFESYYNDSDKFLKAPFDLVTNFPGLSTFLPPLLDPDIAYPLDIDPEMKFVEFVKDTVQREHSKIKNIKFSKSWFGYYPPNYTITAHSHFHDRHFTAVLYLNNNDWHPVNQDQAGCLWTFHTEKGELVHQVFDHQEGTVVFIGGQVWHGTYPTNVERKVFVVDFEYEVDDVL